MCSFGALHFEIICRFFCLFVLPHVVWLLSLLMHETEWKISSVCRWACFSLSVSLVLFVSGFVSLCQWACFCLSASLILQLECCHQFAHTFQIKPDQRSTIGVEILLQISDGKHPFNLWTNWNSILLCFEKAVSQNRKLTQFAPEADLNPNRFLCRAAHICSVTNTNICPVTSAYLFCDQHKFVLWQIQICSVIGTNLFCDKNKFGLWEIQNHEY